MVSSSETFTPNYIEVSPEESAKEISKRLRNEDFVWVEESDFKKIQVDDLIRIENGNFIHQFVVDRIKLEKTHANFFDHYGREFYAFPGTKLFCERPVALPYRTRRLPVGMIQFVGMTLIGAETVGG